MAKTVHDLSAPAADSKSFDAWFYSLPKAQQDRLRDGGVLPYREMVQPRRVCEVQSWRRIWNSTEAEPRIETDSFISREHVGSMLKSFIDALAMTDDFNLRRHVELVRWALDLPGCLPAPDIAKMYDVTKQAIHKRAKHMREQFTPDSLGNFTGEYAKAEREAQERKLAQSLKKNAKKRRK
jgi:hypothetical protein